MTDTTIPKNWLWRQAPHKGGRSVIFDLDGVLCDANGRQHFIRSGNHDWKSFFEACASDQPIEETVRLMRLLADDVTVVLLTGRPIEVQAQTLEWLDAIDLPWDILIMRDRGDYVDSTIFKQQTVRMLKAMDFDVQIAFEDDPLNYEMFEAEGVPCHYVHSGYYEGTDRTSKKLG